MARRTWPSGQQTRGRFIAAVLLCIVNWQFRMSGTNMHKGHAKIGTRAQSCQILMSPSSPLTIEHICMVICFHLVPTVYPHVTHCNTFSTRMHSETSYPLRKMDRVPKGVDILKNVEVLKFENRVPIHSTKRDLNVLAAHSLKTQKSLLTSLKNMWECGFNPKLASKICPEESQAESMKTVPLGPAIPSSDFNKANSQVANLVRSPQEKNNKK